MLPDYRSAAWSAWNPFQLQVYFAIPFLFFKLHVPIIYFNYQNREAFVPQVGLVYVRGCEVEGMLDHLGRIIEEGPDPRPKIPGGQRTFRVW